MDAQEHTTDRQKILNEIKRLKDWEPETIPQPQRRKEIQCARLGVLIGLEEFINSLPAEQPSRELESEIKLYLLRNPVVNHSETSLNESIKRAAIYFANWQKEQNQGYIRKLEFICINLWDILDDIDTYSDLKIDDTDPNNPFKIIEEKTKKRHIFVQTDGYDLFLDNKKLVKKENKQ